MIHVLGVATLLLVLQTDYTQAVCGTPPIVWRNDNITCPERAVCADVFDTTRDWLNGTRCQETRVLSNCLCSGGTVCPTNNPAHQLYSSSSHKLFVCAPACLLPWCENIQLSRSPYNPMNSGRRPFGASRRVSSRRRQTGGTPTVAVTAVQNAREFGGSTYYQMNCLCPRHLYPSTGSRRDRAVKAYRYEYNYTLRRFSTLYTCNSRPSEPQREDPCPRR